MKNLLQFILAYLIVIVAITVSYQKINKDKQKDLSSTQNELNGVVYLKNIYHLGINTSLYQGDLVFEDDKSIVQNSKKNLIKYIDLVAQYQKIFPEFKNDEFNDKINNLQKLDAKNSIEFYEFLDYINHENYRIGDVSKLLFEEDRKSYFLGSLITHYMPEYLISTLNCHNIIEEIVRKGSISDTKRDIFIEQNKLIHLSSEEIKGIIILLEKYNDTQKLYYLISQIQDKLDQLPKNIFDIKNSPKLAVKYIKITHEILELSYQLNDYNIDILEQTLKKRKLLLQETISIYNVTVSFILLIISIIMFLFYRSYTTNISNLKKLEIEKNKTQKALVFKSQFLSNMSHEIRTPLNSIVSLINLTLKTHLDEKQKYMLKKVNAASNILIGVINDILDISKIESGNMTAEKEPFNLKECVTNIYDMLLIKAQEYGISLKINYENISDNNYIGDSLRISQVLTNLINNAIKFTKRGGVSLKVKNMGNDIIKFEIIDTGIGLKQEQIETLFEEFTQADMSTSRKYGGTGLGLSISKNLVDIMGGKINVSSVYGEGSTFSFELPLVESKTKEIDTISDEENDKNLDENRLKKIKNKKILNAEDNKMNQMVISMLLENSNINIDFALDGKIAIEKIKNNNYDLILMDIQMPNMNGYEATKIIRKIYPKIPIIALSANIMKEDIEEALNSGMNDTLAKPIDMDKLYKLLFQYLNTD